MIIKTENKDLIYTLCSLQRCFWGKYYLPVLNYLPLKQLLQYNTK